MNKTDRKKFARYFMIPAVLYFPPEVLGQLTELCSLRQLTAQQLMSEALKSQEHRFDQLIEEVMTPLKPGESTAWPEDPLYCLACVVVIHWIRTFNKMMEDPDAIGATLEQLKKDAPADWVFRSVEELEDDDQADWWKVDESG